MQARLEEHRRSEQARSAEANEKDTLRDRVATDLRLRLATSNTPSATLLTFGIAIEGGPSATNARIAAYAFFATQHRKCYVHLVLICAMACDL